MPTPVVFPNFKGIPLNETEDLVEQDALQQLLSWSRKHGVLSRDCIRFEITPYGGLRAFATHFIPAKQHLLHVPATFNLTFTSLKTELHPDEDWIAWYELEQGIDAFEDKFDWSPYQNEQKDYFSINAMFVMCLYGLLNKLDQQQQQQLIHDKTSTATAPDKKSRSFLMQTLQFYWKALPKDIGNILYNWQDSELWCLHGTSFSNCFPEAQRFGLELYDQVLLPFAKKYSDIFPPETFDIELYFYINTVVLMQSFGQSIGKEDKPALLPIIDLFPGKPIHMFNCTLESCAIAVTDEPENFQRFHVLTSSQHIYAGDEIFIEYASLPASDYLMIYNTIPLDVEFILNNRKTYILLDFDEFLESTLLQKHPNNPSLRHIKRNHIYESFQLPKVIPLTCADLLRASPNSPPACMPTLRQVLIFLQFNEDEAKKSIANGRIQSQLSPLQIYHLFLMFNHLVECSVDKIHPKLFQLLTSNSNAIHGEVWEKMRHDLQTPLEASTDDNTMTSSFGSYHSLAFQTQQGQSKHHKIGQLANLGHLQCPPPYGSMTLSTTKDLTITPNMKSAIFLQMAERLIVELLINHFIRLFPEQFHKLGYAVMRDHLVSSDVNDIMEFVCKPLIVARMSQCIVCGSKKNVSKCSRCKAAFYCSADCQKEHWVYHKSMCKMAGNDPRLKMAASQIMQPEK